MAKRFTSTDKWSDPWYRKLSPKHKCLWDWLFTQCDIAGTIDPDLELASFQIGEQITKDDLKPFEERISILKNGRLFLVKFLEFQYGTLTNDCRAHRPVFKLIEKNSIPYQYPINRHGDRDKEQEQEKDKDKDLSINNHIKDARALKELTWRDDFKIYEAQANAAFDALMVDWNWIAEKKQYYPGMNIRKSLEKMFFEYWSTAKAWKKKKAAKTDEIDWKRTIENGLSMSQNKVWFPKGHLDDEQQYIDIMRRQNEKT